MKSIVLSNAKWIIGCKIAQSLLQLVIGMLSARYLGPANYGLIGYAASVTAFFVPIMQLGLCSTLVREYISDPEREGEILGTSLLMSVISSFACMAGIFCFSAAAGDGTTTVVCVLYSLSLLGQALEMTQYWFQAKLRFQYPSIAMLLGYILVSAYKIYLLVTRKSIFWFALSHGIEYGFIGVLLLGMYRKTGNQKLRASRGMARDLFCRSRYYILSGMMVTIFQSTDQIMLKLMINERENGIYAAAVTCAGMANFVYLALIDSARPVILEKKQQSQRQFEDALCKLYCAVIYLALAQSLAFTLLAKPIVGFLYGTEYASSASVLRILAWQVGFSVVGTVRNVWILAQQRQEMLWKLNLGGAAANIVLNAFLIPAAGACGAAVASVFTQFAVNFLLGYAVKPLRRNNRLILKGGNPKFLAEMLLEAFKTILPENRSFQR